MLKRTSAKHSVIARLDLALLRICDPIAQRLIKGAGSAAAAYQAEVIDTAIAAERDGRFRPGYTPDAYIAPLKYLLGYIWLVVAGLVAVPALLIAPHLPFNSIAEGVFAVATATAFAMYVIHGIVDRRFRRTPDGSLVARHALSNTLFALVWIPSVTFFVCTTWFV